MSANKLTIWMNGLLVGYWMHKQGKDELQYSQSWVEHPQGRPLSLSLPFVPGNLKHRGDRVKYYFDNLLPDSSEIRERLASRFKAKDSSPFNLLAEIGRDCIGAIQLLPEGEQPKSIKHINYKVLTDSDVEKKLINTVSDQFFNNDKDGLRISLAGAQEKTALLFHKGKWCLPEGSTPTTHIFKLPLGLIGGIKADMRDSVENEWLCAKIIDAFHLPAASCGIATFGVTIQRK